ncbi:TIGR03885 family FMN-dependent LLM class oxidoreductase [Paludisphaera soli]|uniref:TIGR03885 family FMN-dependent LLM class oxidoreductase n=1 Tax=Paludisphaera soli TaxID=2712865 RepID=UPI0013EC405D|nr:TIGR03885 family FMN-dependent LLM class oxidoreductase [Paludisphaera soli]
MATIGFHCAHEQHAPSELLRLARLAEASGFGAGMCSDHFHPWLPEQGQSGFSFAWLGAAMQATGLSFGTVCAPGDRYHPAIVAQAAATLGQMFPGRFWLSVASGEALNEHVTGAPWPPKPARHARPLECVEAIRALWRGETVDHEGLVTVKDARLYTTPETPPLVVGAALTEETARWAGGWADALITVAGEPDPLRKRIDAFREGGGEGKPLFLQVALSYAETDDEALRAAHREWRQAGLDPGRLADLPSPEAFAEAARAVTPEMIRDRLRVSSDPSRFVDWLARDAELGFERIYLHNLGRNQDAFIETFAGRVLPQLR